MRSIRRRLLLTLFVLWTTVWIAVALSTFERSGHEIGELMDAQLAQTANVLRQIAVSGHLPELLPAPQILSPIGHPYESKISFQLWSNGKLIDSAGAAPREALGQGPGFSDQTIGDTRWRVFGLPSSTPGELIYVGQSYSIRNELIEYLTLHALRPILWSLPLSVLLIWMAVTDGLRPLGDLSRDIANRSPEDLRPIDTDRAPAEIRPLVRSLNGLMHRVEQVLNAERHFTADASHELRTPFSIIRTHAQIALRSKDPHERAEALAQLMRGIDRTSRLISQLLTLSRLRSSQRGTAVRPGSLARTLDQALRDHEPAARRKGVQLSRDLGAGEAGIVSVPSSALAILVGNLLDNAIKFTPTGGSVRVRIEERRTSVLLEVADSGPGISASDKERVFDRFYRPAGQPEPGAGLGLAIVRRICELHGAKITLLDGEGRPGLTVAVSFRRPF